MLYVNLTPGFRTGAVRALRTMAPAAESLRIKVFKGASTAAVGAIAGWGAVVAVGAMLVSGASHEPAPSAPGPAMAAIAAPVPAVAATPIAPAAPAAPRQVAAAPAPAPAPAPVKVTQRVDMSPTAAIPEAPKPHKKPKKKKPLDSEN